MKLALHRSLIFWSGILVIGFICWSWWDSRSHGIWARSGEWSAGNGFSGLGIRFNGSSAAQPFALGRDPHSLPNMAPEFFPPLSFFRGQGLSSEDPSWTAADWNTGIRSARTIGELQIASMKPLPRTDWELFTPHWLILLSFAVPWLALLFWRARRRKRAMATTLS